MLTFTFLIATVALGVAIATSARCSYLTDRLAVLERDHSTTARLLEQAYQDVADLSEHMVRQATSIRTLEVCQCPNVFVTSDN